MSTKNSKLRNLFKGNAFSDDHTIDKQKTKGNVLSPQLPSSALNQPDLIIAISPEDDIVSQTSKRFKESFGSNPVFSNALGGEAENIKVNSNENNDQQIQLLLTYIPGHKMKSNVEGVYLIINDFTELSQLEQSLELMKKQLNHTEQIAESDVVQGYLFSDPVALKTFEQKLQTAYLLPSKKKLTKIPEVEHREFFRIEFPYNVLGHMTILEVNNRQVSLGTTQILLKDISLGGMKIISLLKLPINSNMKFMFTFTLMSELFELEGALIWKDDAKEGMFVYGVKLNFNDEDRLAPLINRISLHLKTNQQIPDTAFIYEDPILFLNEHLT